jgi:hypothetical protein
MFWGAALTEEGDRKRSEKETIIHAKHNRGRDIFNKNL